MIGRLQEIVGQKGWVDPGDSAPYLSEWRDRVQGKALAIVRPDSVQQISDLVRYACETDLAIVAQGGNTGLCGGAIPGDERKELLIVLDRLNTLEPVDLVGRSILVDAGCTLAAVQATAAASGLRMGVSLASDGTATIGGAISTNAGGIQVLRYGNMREQVIGLEVVLADGQIWSDLRDLRKSNEGYDLKHLFIGAEGTLGVVTRIRLKLWEKPRASVTALLGIRDIRAAVELQSRLRRELGDIVSAAELISARALEFVVRHIPGARNPFSSPPPYSLLLEFEGHNQMLLDQELDASFSKLLEENLLADSVVAGSETEAQALWHLRHSISAAQKPEGGSIKFDIALPINSMADFDCAARKAIEHKVPGARPVIFGHVGDGNLHYNISAPDESETRAFLQQREAVESAIYKLVTGYGGTISAEHGIGVFKKAAFEQFVPPLKRELMTRMKSALDPEQRMNPGKVLNSKTANATARRARDK